MTIEEILNDTTPALVHLGFDAERAGMRVVRSSTLPVDKITGRIGGFIDIERSAGLDEAGRPLWGVRVYLTPRRTFLVAKRFDGPHVSTVHTIHEVRSILFDPDYGAP
jgi:hypothetical protein